MRHGKYPGPLPMVTMDIDCSGCQVVSIATSAKSVYASNVALVVTIVLTMVYPLKVAGVNAPFPEAAMPQRRIP